MNKVKIEPNKDGTYNLTLPGAGQTSRSHLNR